MAKRRRIPQEVRDRLLVEAMHRCCLCPEHNDVTDLHHVVPISEGGPNSEENLMVVCPTCHAKIHRLRKRYTPEQLRMYKERWVRLCGLGLPLDARLSQAFDYTRPPEQVKEDVEQVHIPPSRPSTEPRLSPRIRETDPASAGGAPEQKLRVELAQTLATHFDKEELRTLCFHLGIDYDDLPAEGKGNKAREIVKYLERRSRIAELVETGRRLRPDVPWGDTPEGTGQRSPTFQGASQQVLPKPNPFVPLSGRISDPGRVFGREREMARAKSCGRGAASRSSARRGWGNRLC